MAGPIQPDDLDATTERPPAADPLTPTAGIHRTRTSLPPALVVFLGNLVARGLGFLFPVVLANVLGRPEFATAIFLINTGFFAGELILTGFPTAMTRSLAAEADIGSRRAWILAAAVGGLPLLALSVALGSVLAIRGDAPVALLALVIVGLTIDAYYFGLLRGLRRFGWLAIYRVAANLAQLVIILLLAVVGGAELSLGIVVAVYSLIYLLPIAIIEVVDGPGRTALRRTTTGSHPPLDTRRLVVLTRFAIPALISGTAYGAILGFDVFFVRIFAPQELADYAAARSLAVPMLLVPFALSVVLLPQVAAATGPAVGRLLRRALGIAVAAAVAGTLAYFLIGPTLVERILPPSYAAAVEPLAVLVPSVAVIGVYSILSGWLLGIGRPWTAALCLAAGATVTIIGHTVLTSEYGAVGAGVAMGIGATTALLLASLASWRILRSGNPSSVAGASR